MNKKEFQTQIDLTYNLIEECKKLKKEVVLSKSLFKNKIENYLKKIILSKNLKEVKIIFKSSYIDFYKNYNGVEVKLLRLFILTTSGLPITPTTSIKNFNLITYNGHNSEDWEYQKLIDIGEISSKTLKNKNKILKKLDFFKKKDQLTFNKIKKHSLKLILQIDKKEIQIHKLIVSRMEYYLKSSILDLSKAPKGFLSCTISQEGNIKKNVTSIELVKNSKYVVKYNTTELNEKGFPIVWKVKVKNLRKFLNTQLQTFNVDILKLNFLFLDE